MIEDRKAMAAAMQQIATEKGIPIESIVETLQLALAAAYRKDFGLKNQNAQCEFDLKTGNWRLFDVKTVSDKPQRPEKTPEELAAEEEMKKLSPQARRFAAENAAPEAATAESAEGAEPEIEYMDEKSEISVEDAQALKKGAVVGDVIKTELIAPAEYGRMAAMTAKQVIIQRLREAERERIFAQFTDKVGEMFNATVQRVEGRMVFLDLLNAQAIMPPPEQANGEKYHPGERLRVYLVSVNKGTKGPEIIVSRAHPEMVRKLFSIEVPEIEAGSVEIRAVAREAGSRSKIAVFANEANIDPVGSCVGQRGARVQTVIAELGGEKIDIIEWSDDAVQFITHALSPAKIVSVKLNEANKEANVEVHEDQLSLAIGRGGQNVRLASQLSGWKINLVNMDAIAGGKKKEEKVGSGEGGAVVAEGEVKEVVEEKAEAVEEKVKEVMEEKAEEPEVKEVKEEKSEGKKKKVKKEVVEEKDEEEKKA